MKSTSSSGIGVSSSFALTVIIAMKPITATGVPIAAPELSDNGMCTRPAGHARVGVWPLAYPLPIGHYACARNAVMLCGDGWDTHLKLRNPTQARSCEITDADTRQVSCARAHRSLVLFENRAFDNVLGHLYGHRETGSELRLARHRQEPEQSHSRRRAEPHGADRNSWFRTAVATDMDSPNPDSGEEYFHTNTQFNVPRRQPSIGRPRSTWNAPPPVRRRRWRVRHRLHDVHADRSPTPTTCTDGPPTPRPPRLSHAGDHDS